MPFYWNVQKETMEPSAVLLMRRVRAYGPENRQLMNRMKGWISSHGLWEQKTTLLGIPWDNPSMTRAEACRYDVCMLWDKETIPETDEVIPGQFSGGMYAVFLLEHTAEAVQAAWSGYSAALPVLGFTVDASRPVMERYRKELVDRHLCELCVPILK